MNKFVPMIDSFENMPDSSRLWAYQSERPFNQEELKQIDFILTEFVEKWAAHGKSLKAAYKIFHHQFIILAVDESYQPASGCSIDDSVSIIRDLEQKFGIQLLDRTRIAFLVNDQVEIYPLSEIKSKIQSGEIEEQTAIFNNFVQKMGEFKSSWVQPAKESWASRYFV